jgi:methionyl-tRNA formyltransferase
MISKNANNPRVSIVFFGTGQTSLEALQCLSEVFDIELVVTKPPAHNSAGKQFKNAVQLWAENNSIGVINPSSKADISKLVGSTDIKSPIAVVLDFGMIIPKDVIETFEYGILNSHFSLLPKYRGADPIRTALINGDVTTEVTIIKITPGLDDGPILTWAELDCKDYNATELREKLSALNCALLPETVQMLLQGQLDAVEQDEAAVNYTTKTTKQDGLIDSAKPASELANEVRAYAGWPKSYIVSKDNTYIVLSALASKQTAARGELQAEGKKLYFGCADGCLQILSIQPAGKAPMDAASFINGYLGSS